MANQRDVAQPKVSSRKARSSASVS